MLQSRSIRLLYYLPLVLGFVTSCYRPTENIQGKDRGTIKENHIDTNKTIHEIEPASWDTVPCGDLNADEILDTAFVYTPRTMRNMNSKGDTMSYEQIADSLCYNRVRFSCAWPEMKFHRSVWGRIANAGDLNGDGKSEILFSPGWFWSCWGRIYFCSLKKKGWLITTEVTAHICTDESLQRHLLRKGKRYYLKGEKFEDGDQIDYEVPVKF